MTRRVEVQRWPAVPTAPKKIDCAAISRSALGRNDERVVAAEFQDAPSEPAVDRFRHCESHARRAGRGDERDAPIRRERFADRFARRRSRG